MRIECIPPIWLVRHVAVVPMLVRFDWKIAVLVLGVLILIGLGLLVATDWFDWRLVPSPTPNRY